MGFMPSKADPDIWMKDNGYCYEYVACYVNDLIAIMADPKAFFIELEKKGFGLKGVTDTPEIFLGGSLGRDPDRMLHWGAKCYIACSMETYEQIVGSKPMTRTVPMVQPELDTLAEIDAGEHRKYQSLIGILQWIVTLGRFDIACTVMTMSRFRTAPWLGHLTLLGNIFGYLCSTLMVRSDFEQAYQTMRIVTPQRHPIGREPCMGSRLRKSHMICLNQKEKW
jgi:hypothetical protein